MKRVFTTQKEPLYCYNKIELFHLVASKSMLTGVQGDVMVIVMPPLNLQRVVLEDDVMA